MEIDVKIVRSNAKLYRRSDGHDLGLIGQPGALVAISNGNIVAILYAGGIVRRYDVETRRGLGIIGSKGAVAIAMARGVLVVVFEKIARYYEPRTGKQIVHAELGSDTGIAILAKTPATGIAKIRALAKRKN